MTYEEEQKKFKDFLRNLGVDPDSLNWAALHLMFTEYRKTGGKPSFGLASKWDKEIAEGAERWEFGDLSSKELTTALIVPDISLMSGLTGKIIKWGVTFTHLGIEYKKMLKDINGVKNNIKFMDAYGSSIEKFVMQFDTELNAVPENLRLNKELEAIDIALRNTVIKLPHEASIASEKIKEFSDIYKEMRDSGNYPFLAERIDEYQDWLLLLDEHSISNVVDEAINPERISYDNIIEQEKEKITGMTELEKLGKLKTIMEMYHSERGRFKEASVKPTEKQSWMNVLEEKPEFAAYQNEFGLIRSHLHTHGGIIDPDDEKYKVYHELGYLTDDLNKEILKRIEQGFSDAKKEIEARKTILKKKTKTKGGSQSQRSEKINFSPPSGDNGLTAISPEEVAFSGYGDEAGEYRDFIMPFSSGDVYSKISQSPLSWLLLTGASGDNFASTGDNMSTSAAGSFDPLGFLGGLSGRIGDIIAESVGYLDQFLSSGALMEPLEKAEQQIQGIGFTLNQAEESANQFAFTISNDIEPAVNNLSMSAEKDSKSKKNPAEEAKSLSEHLKEAARWGSQIANAFVGVDQNIARVIGSASTLAGGVSGIFDAFDGDEVDGLALMSGIQGAAAGLSGVLGLDASSDEGQLVSGLGGVGAGIAGLLTDNPLEGIQSIISSLPSLVDGLFESWDEGFYKQFNAMGFDDQYSDELLEKMEDAADRLGSKEAGVIDNIEDFFDETNISNEDEFTHMSMFLDQAIQNYINQGHTAEEAFEKFGDELGELKDIQEQNGYETNENLERMIEMQASETAEGRIEHIKGAMEGYDKMLAGLEKQLEIGNLELSETSMGAMASSFLKSYRQLMDDGYSGSQALEVVQPMMDRYAEIMNEQGYGTEGIPGWNDLMAHFDKLESVSGYIDMMQGSEEVLRQLGESHLLDTKTFQGQESLAGDVYGQMMTAGMSDEQALKEMAGWLAEMQTAAERQGFELSDDIAGMIARADEYGIDIEGAEKKSPGQILEDGIASGFDLAIDAINTNLFNLPQFGEGGIVPGSGNEMKLIWAHAGEAVGYPEKLARMLELNHVDTMIPQIGIVDASPLSAFMEKHLEQIDVNAPLVDIMERYDRGEISNMSESMRENIIQSGNEIRKTQARQMEAESESFKEELAKRIAEKLKRMQGSSGTEKIEINSEIALNVNGRDLVQQIKPRHFRNTKVSLGII